jgi:16S rRNA (guanine527-N7)-methyltransferase
MPEASTGRDRRAIGDPTLIARSTRDELERILSAAPSVVVLAPAALDRIERYVALLLSANRALNLTRIVEPAAIATAHLLDALSALPCLDALAPDRLVDLGSGGGVPAIPLALARPSWRWTLIESVGKKAAALREIAAALGLAQVEVIGDRAEAVGHRAIHREAYDVATARAVAPLPVLAELGLPLLRVGGTLIAWKGPVAAGDGELSRGARTSSLLGGGPPSVVPAPFAELGERTLVTIRKEQASPARYPRRPGEPARRPLA